MKKILSATLIFAIILAMLMPVTAFATVGQQLTSPETGWTRYDDTNAAFKYTGSWTASTPTGFYNSTNHVSSTANDTISFIFTGTRIRIYDQLFNNRGYAQITIDGVSQTFSAYSTNSNSSNYDQTVVYEQTGLSSGSHTVTITVLGTKPSGSAYAYVSLDAIDIDSTGSLLGINQPTNLQALSGANQVALTWNAVQGATSYNVKRSTTSGGPYTTIATNVTTNSYTDTNVANNTTYYYVVSSIVSGAESINSFEASVVLPPSAPANLTATSGNSQASLTWGSVTGATYYVLERSTTSGGPYTIISSSVTSNTYVDTGLTNGTTYYYVIQAKNAGGTSGNSNEASATPQVAAPTAPTNLTATAGNAQVSLNWSAASGSTSYVLERATTSGGPYTVVSSNITATSYTDSGLTNGTTYYYVVQAENAGGTSNNSNEASATPVAPIVDRAILKITLTNGFEKEYDLSMTEVNAFIAWYEAKEAGTGTASYAIDMHDNNKGPFKSRKDYVIFDKILTYEVNEYTPAQ